MNIFIPTLVYCRPSLNLLRCSIVLHFLKLETFECKLIIIILFFTITLFWLFQKYNAKCIIA